jgi:hypothetical protein
MVADTFMQDQRWQDYMRVVTSGLATGLTWKQYIAAIDNTQRWGNHESRHWTHHLARAPPQPQAQEPRSQVPRWMEAAIPVPSKKDLKLKEHRRRVALMAGEDDAEGACKRRIAQRRRILEEAERRQKAARWSRNRGEAAKAVPFLPAELWARIFRQGREEREQHTAWAAWANARLMQLVVVWFRKGGQRNSKWLGNLRGKNGGISCADTANIATRFAPWCRSVLRPGEANEPLHYKGASAVPADFTNIYEHMLTMMKYLGFHNVIERLQLIMRVLARCTHPDSGVPKYVPGPPDSDDESDGDELEDVPEPGQQPARPQKHFVARA